MLSWTWNNTLTFNNSDLSIEIGFTSNGQHFDRLSSQKVDGIRYFGYCNGTTCTPAYEYNSQSTGGIWINSSFKNITFDTLPNEQLMSILSANATVSKNVSKVEINGATLIDISNDTVTADTLAEGYTAHDKTGNVITGTMTVGTPNLQSKSVTYTSNGTATVMPDSGYDGLSSVDVTVDVASGGGGTTIPGIVELFTTSGLHYYPEYAQTINITFSAWPKYFGVYCTDGNEQNIFIGPAVYFGDMANYVNIENQVIINEVNFNAGVVVIQTYEYVNYYFLSDVEMTINTQ